MTLDIALCAGSPFPPTAQVIPNHYRPTANAALILSADPLAGALIGAAVELAGVPPAFAGKDESSRAALRRVRPAFVLLSVDDPAVHDEAFLGPAMMTGARLFLFGSERSMKLLESHIVRYQLCVVVLPRDAEKLREILTAASESSPRPRETTAP